MEKKCSKCNNVLPATTEYFYKHQYKGRDGGLFGLRAKCISCTTVKNKKESAKPTVRVCEYCKNEFTIRYQPNRKYCSRKCSSLSRGKPLYSKVCEYCGSDYTTARKEQKYCLRDCYAKSQRTLIGTIRKCIICGTEYEPIRKKQQCCSQECQKVATNEAIIKGLENEARVCGSCGVEFIPTRINQEYCKKTCREKSFYQKNQDYFLNRRYIRRANPVNRVGQEVSIDELYEKAKGLCGICGKVIDKSIKHPHPLSLSLDHILPISRGGLHTIDNVQVAHMSCNSKKGNRKFITNNSGQLMMA